MATVKKRQDFATSEEGVSCRTILEDMEADKGYFTEPSFTVDIEKFPKNEKPFVMTHMDYLVKHSEVNPKHYISNLRIRLRKNR
jgi:hypothetical protein